MSRKLRDRAYGKDFLIVNTSIFTDARLSNHDKYVFLFLCTLPEDFNFNIDLIPGRVGGEKLAVLHSLVALKNRGYISINPVMKDDKLVREDWILNEHPDFDAKKCYLVGEHAISGKELIQKLANSGDKKNEGKE